MDSPPLGAALPGLSEALLLAGVVLVVLLLRSARQPAPAVAVLPAPAVVLSPVAAEVVAYLRARGERVVQAHADNPVLAEAVRAGALSVQGRLFSPQGALAQYRVVDALWQAPATQPAPAAPPWLPRR